MGMKTRGSSGGGEKWGQPALSTRRKRRSLGQSRQSPFFADSAVFEGACTTWEVDGPGKRRENEFGSWRTRAATPRDACLAVRKSMVTVYFRQGGLGRSFARLPLSTPG